MGAPRFDPLTSWRPFLDVAPVVIAIFGQTYGVRPDGSRIKHDCAAESVGIATDQHRVQPLRQCLASSAIAVSACLNRSQWI
jgi:hypothetical protein